MKKKAFAFADLSPTHNTHTHKLSGPGSSFAWELEESTMHAFEKQGEDREEGLLKKRKKKSLLCKKNNEEN